MGMTFTAQQAVTTIVGPPPDPAEQMTELTVDDTPGGVGFDPDDLQRDGVWAEAASCHLENADIRYREDGGAPTAASGIPRISGDTFVVQGLAALQNFRATRVGDVSAKITSTLSF